MRTNGKVAVPVDLPTILKKAEQYDRLSELESDISWFIHGCKITHLSKKDVLAACEELRKFLCDEISSMKECVTCYENLYRYSNGFEIPCEANHEVVLAKTAEYAFWPAKLMQQFEDDSASVRYFGDHSMDKVASDHWKVYSSDSENDDDNNELLLIAKKVRIESIIHSSMVLILNIYFCILGSTAL